MMMQMEPHSIQALLMTVGIPSRVQLDEWALLLIVVDSAHFTQQRAWVEARFCAICQDGNQTYLRARLPNYEIYQ